MSSQFGVKFDTMGCVCLVLDNFDGTCCEKIDDIVDLNVF